MLVELARRGEPVYPTLEAALDLPHPPLDGVPAHANHRDVAPDPIGKAAPAELDHRRSDHQHVSWYHQRGREGLRIGLDHDSVVSCDNIMTLRMDAVGDTIGLLFDDQEPELARAISDAFELFLP